MRLFRLPSYKPTEGQDVLEALQRYFNQTFRNVQKFILFHYIATNHANVMGSQLFWIRRIKFFQILHSSVPFKSCFLHCSWFKKEKIIIIEIESIWSTILQTITKKKLYFWPACSKLWLFAFHMQPFLFVCNIVCILKLFLKRRKKSSHAHNIYWKKNKQYIKKLFGL